VIGNEVNCTTTELWAIVVICTVAVRLNGRVVILFSIVDVCTKRTNPLMSVLNPTHERIDVGSTLLTPDDGIIFERYGWYFLAL